MDSLSKVLDLSFVDIKNIIRREDPEDPIKNG